MKSIYIILIITLFFSYSCESGRRCSNTNKDVTVYNNTAFNITVRFDRSSRPLLGVMKPFEIRRFDIPVGETIEAGTTDFSYFLFVDTCKKNFYELIVED